MKGWLACSYLCYCCCISNITSGQ